MAQEKKFNLDRFIAIIAFLISIATLFTFIYQTRLMRTQQYASVMPYLLAGHEGLGQKEYQYTLSNVGLGPAFVEDVRVIYKKKTYVGDLDDFLTAHSAETKDTINYGYSSVYPGMLIPANATVEMLQNSGNYENAEEIWNLMEAADVQIKFRSIYDEKWILSTDEGIPKRLN